ncbi:MAG: hypothetical protein M1451_05560 [Acidobacteria bacterium]|nr:hypothetical protein [Acidobacteriota bacterium]
MSQRCAHKHSGGSYCKRWATGGSPFCYRHQPPPEKPVEEDDANLSPLDRLTTHDDVFDVVRETLNAIRLGRVSPGRAYATGYFIDLWLRVRERMDKAGPDTKKFQKRRRMSNAVEQATFDMVAEKVVQVITGRTIEQIERDGGQVTRPGEDHWTQRPLSIIDEMLGVRVAEAEDAAAAAAAAAASSPAPGQSAPAVPAQPAPGDPRDSSPAYPLPKNWGREEGAK